MTEQVSPDRVSRAVRAYFLAIRAMDAEAFANCFAEDGTTYDPVDTPGITGRTAIREFLESICKNFKTVGLTEESVFIAGEVRRSSGLGRAPAATVRMSASKASTSSK